MFVMLLPELLRCNNYCDRPDNGCVRLGIQGKIQVSNRATDEEEEEQAAAQAAAVAVALAESVAGSPPARSVCATPPPRTPYASSGGTTPQNDRVRLYAEKIKSSCDRFWHDTGLKSSNISRLVSPFAAITLQLLRQHY